MKKNILYLLCIILLICCSCENKEIIDKPVEVSNDIYYKYTEDNKELLISSVEKEGYEKSSFDEIHNLYYKYDYNIEIITFEKGNNKFCPNTLKYVCGNYKLSEINGFENIDTSYVEDYSYSFGCCNCITDEILNNLKTGSGKLFNNMFENCGSLYSFDFSKYDFSKAECLDNMFFCCYNLEDVSLNNCDFSNVTSMSNMFSGCQNLKQADFSYSNFEKCINVTCLFDNCYMIQNILFDNASFNSIEYIPCMFASCYTLETIDLSSFDLSNLIECVDASNLDFFSDFRPFGFCPSASRLKSIFFPKSFDATFIDRDRFYEGCDSLEAIYYKDGDNIELIKSFKE